MSAPLWCWRYCTLGQAGKRMVGRLCYTVVAADSHLLLDSLG